MISCRGRNEGAFIVSVLQLTVLLTITAHGSRTHAAIGRCPLPVNHFRSVPVHVLLNNLFWLSAFKIHYASQFQ
jgi:hypothetical protein